MLHPSIGRSRRWRRLPWWGKAVVVLMFTVLTGSLSASPAAAAGPGCGSACDNTDPNQPVYSAQLGATVTCADDAITARQTGTLAAGITLQLRYSPRCRTVWGRFWGGTSRTFVVSLYSQHWGIFYQAMTELRPGGRNWSDQMDEIGFTAKACIGTSWNFLDNIGCTDFY